MTDALSDVAYHARECLVFGFLRHSCEPGVYCPSCMLDDALGRLEAWRGDYPDSDSYDIAVSAIDALQDGLAEEVEEQRGLLIKVIAAAVRYFGSAGPCRYDHHGYCQEHWIAEGSCPVAEFRDVMDIRPELRIRAGGADS